MPGKIPCKVNAQVRLTEFRLTIQFAQLSPQNVVPKLYQYNIFNEHFRLYSFTIDAFSKNLHYFKFGEEHQQLLKNSQSK